MNHPITPPPELVQQWDKEAAIAAMPDPIYIATQAARRPKPLSLKEQALEALDEERAEMSIQNYMAIRSVLESIPDSV